MSYVTVIWSVIAAGSLLLAVMYGSWTPIVHLPILFAQPHNHGSWNENATNIVLTGVAWVIADALGRGTQRKAG